MKLGFLFATLIVAADATTAQAATFTYSGSLQDSGKPAQGHYDLELTLYSASTGGSVISGPLMLYGVPVDGGRFSTEADFGPAASSLSQAYVSVRVRIAGAKDFAALDARAPVAVDASANACHDAWTLLGNANGSNSGTFLGTTDASDPLIFKVGNLQAGQIIASTLPFPANDSPSVVFGSSRNTIGSGIVGATIAGGGDGAAYCGGGLSPCANSATANFASVGGGFFNTATGQWSMVAGGNDNSATNDASAIGGGYRNTASGYYSVVAGGNTNRASGDASTVAGGEWNFATGEDSSVGGGYANTASGVDSLVAGGVENTASAIYAVVSGGLGNQAMAVYSTISGGASNIAGGSTSLVSGGEFNTADGQYSVVAGGTRNFADGYLATVAGGYGNFASGDRSFAAGTQASVRRAAATCNPGQNCGDHGTFVWSDDSSGVFESTGPDQFLIRAIGGLGINTNNPNGVSMRVGTDTSNGNGAYVSNGGSWTNGSSRSFKEAFAPVDVGTLLDKVLALPVQTWFYKNGQREGRHLGPMAEDFAQAFELGSDDKYIATVDESGVALAAIQGLNQKIEGENASLKETTRALSDQSESLARENAELRSKLDDVLARLKKLEGKQGE
jgi:hypothetical protein